MTYQTETLSQMKNNLKTLNPMELEELDEIITPRAAELLSKAFGQGIYDLLAPLTEDDENLDKEDQAHGNYDIYREKNTGPQANSGSEEALRKMMRDPRYWRERDPEMIEKVTKGFGRLYPNQ